MLSEIIQVEEGLKQHDSAYMRHLRQSNLQKHRIGMAVGLGVVRWQKWGILFNVCKISVTLMI